MKVKSNVFIKGSFFWYGFLLSVLGYFLYSWSKTLDSNTQDDELKSGFTFYSKDDEVPLLFRFSFIHFVMFLVNVILILPVINIGEWCDRHITVGNEKKDEEE